MPKTEPLELHFYCSISVFRQWGVTIFQASSSSDERKSVNLPISGKKPIVALATCESNATVAAITGNSTSQTIVIARYVPWSAGSINVDWVALC